MESDNIILIPNNIEPEYSMEEIDGRQHLVTETTSTLTLHNPPFLHDQNHIFSQ